MRNVLTRATRSVRPPGPLVALLCATAILALGWIAVVPPFQAPDENGHFAYVQFLAERGELPASDGPPTLSTALSRAALAANSLQTQQQLGTKPEWAESAHDRYLQRTAREDASDRRDGGPTPAAVNPPLYYLWELPAYSIASGGDLFARATVMRLWTVPFLLITVAATWLLAGVVFGPQTERQLAAAAVPALFPMVGFISGSINPDGLLYALWSVAFLLGARILVGRGQLLDLIGLLVVVGLAIATKAVSLALAPAVLLVLGVLLWRNRARRTLVTTVVALSVLLFGVAVAWLGVRQQLWGLRAASAPSGDLARQLPAQRLRELPVAVLPAQLAVPERLSPARGLAAASLRILDSAELGGLRLARGAMVEGGVLALGGGRPHGGHRGWTRHLATACSRQSEPSWRSSYWQQ